MIRFSSLSCLALVLAAGVSTSLHAQDELKRLDKNGDGYLEKSEVPEQAQRIVERLAERAGMNADQPLPIDKLEEALKSGGNSDERNREDREREDRRSDDRGRDDRGRYSRGSDRDRDRSDDDRGSSRSSSSSSTASNSGFANSSGGVPGFGVAVAGLPPVPGFDVPLGTGGTERPVEQVFDPRAIERARRTLRDNDKDGSGYLEGEEIDKGRWTNPPVEESDLNKDGKLSLYELCGRYAKRYGWNDTPGVSKSSSGSSSDSRDQGSSGGSDKVRAYAESLLKQYDENKDGLLQKDEWMKMRSDYHTADQNGDTVLTVDEIYVKLSALSSSTGSSSSSSSGSSGSSSSSSNSSGGYSSRYGSRYSRDRGSSSSGSSGSSSKSDPNGKVVRFLTPTERLPKGLPEWFLRNDADGDGQILMSEYAAAWTESTAAEFKKYDLNDDGFITPVECLDALEMMKKK